MVFTLSKNEKAFMDGLMTVLGFLAGGLVNGQLKLPDDLGVPIGGFILYITSDALNTVNTGVAPTAATLYTQAQTTIQSFLNLPDLTSSETALLQGALVVVQQKAAAANKAAAASSS